MFDLMKEKDFEIISKIAVGSNAINFHTALSSRRHLTSKGISSFDIQFNKHTRNTDLVKPVHSNDQKTNTSNAKEKENQKSPIVMTD